MPKNLLNFPAYSIVSVKEDEHDYHIQAEVTQAPADCKLCKAPAPFGFGRREQLIKDLPIHGKRVGIYINTRRMKCRSCEKTFSEYLPEIDEKRLMTSRLVQWIGRAAVKKTFISIAEEVGITEGTVRSIFADFVAEREKEMKFETPKWMGIDEIHLTKPRGVITNIQNNSLVEILKDRNKTTVIDYLSRLPDRRKVELVAMDMWKPYRDAVEEIMPNAIIVIDKFHVVKMANEALEKARKSLRESLSPKQRRGLMHDRYVLLRRTNELSDKDFLLMDGWTKNYPILGDAYRLKESFFEIYTATSSYEARQKYGEWRRSVPPELHDHFSDLIRAFENWQPYILNYFDNPATNAYTESLNSLIRMMSRLGRGYSFEALRAKLLFSEGANKAANKKPAFKRERRSVEPANMKMMIGYADLDFFELPKAPKPRPKFDREPSTPQKKNYGADISTLIKLLESGEL